MPVYDEYKLAFIHIPKTAGSSIEFALGKSRFYATERNYKFGVCPQHYYASELLSQCPEIESYRRFTVVRNPYDRLVSAYLYNSKLYWTNGLGFDEFVKKALSLDHRSRRFIFDGHLDAQSSYLDTTLSFSIFKYERLPSLLQYLHKVTNRTLKFPHLNKSDRQSAAYYFQNDFTVETVRNFYSEDFKLFDYDVKLI